jgi:hypothetical protein
MRTKRRRLIWVTALTVASLLLGSSAINALAEGRGGREHSNGGQSSRNAALATSQGCDDKESHNHGDVQRKHGDDDNEDLVTAPASATEEVRPGEHENDNNHDDDKDNNDDGMSGDNQSAVTVDDTTSSD